MPDWTRYVRERLSLPDYDAIEERDVVEEVASQLEDVYLAARDRGATAEQAEEETASHIEDWEALAEAIRRAAPGRRESRGYRGAERADEALRNRGAGAHWLADIMLDVRYAVRTLRRSPGFAAAVVLLIGLGVGANTAVFSVLKAVYLQPMAYPEPSELMVLWETTTRGGRGPASWRDYLDWKHQSQSFEAMGATGELAVNLTDGDTPELVMGAMATASLFEVFGTNAALGRALLPEEDGADARVVVLSDELWSARYGADPDILGTTIRLSGEPHTVVGVMPRGFAITSPWNANERYQLWTNFPSSVLEEPRDSHSYPVYGRLRDGVTPEAAREDMERTALNLAAAFPETNLTQRVRVQPLHRVLYGDVGDRLLLILGAAGLVLLTACGNVAGLLLARAAIRRREVAIRAALGAGRGRVVRQLLTEGGLLALTGGLVAVVAVFGGVQALRGSLPATIPRTIDITVDAEVLGFALAISLITGLIFALAPALEAARAFHLEALKGGSSTRHHRWGARNVFVVGQLALTLMLAHGTVLLVGSYLLLRGQDHGFEPENVLTMAVSLSGPAFGEEEARQAFLRELLPRLDALPGVRRAAAINRLPFEGGTNDSIVIEGREIPPDPNDRPLVERKAVMGEYLQVMGIPLETGRMVSDADAEGVHGVVINRCMADRIWPGEDPLGKRFSFAVDPPSWLTVVGVAGDVSQWGPEWDAIPEAYRPYGLYPEPTMYLVLKTDVPPRSLARAVRHAVLEADADTPVTQIRTMTQLLGSQFAQRELMTALVGLFALLALVLAVAGVYGVVAYFVAQRTHELGLRMALGAGRGQLLGLVLRRGLLLAAAGAALGAALALAASRLTNSMLFGLSPTDPWSMGGVAALVLSVGVAATLIPARRATAVDPARALQAE